jgi:hypothetical protein
MNCKVPRAAFDRHRGDLHFKFVRLRWKTTNALFCSALPLRRFLFICSQVTAADGKLLAARARERQFQFTVE